VSRLSRVALVLEYDGRPWAGWQRQDNARSIQEALEEALARIESARRSTVAAGRTDAGVHAEAMLVHADVSADRLRRAPGAYLHGLNASLPPSVRVIGLRSVPERFHARFDCRARSYRYRIWNRNTASALQAWRHWWMPRRLDLDRMRSAAECCLGERDFSAFRASGCQSSHAVRRLDELRISREAWEVRIDVRANGFVYRMVRNLVGALVAVGTGQLDPAAFAELMERGKRSQMPATAPAHGLYFTNAWYDGFDARALIGSMEGEAG